jgi:hypothetical protein
MVKKALFIGINYTGTSAQLNGCINDVYNVRNFLMQNCGYTTENMKVLTDNDIIPTNKAIKENIEWLLSGASEGDTLFFHYSGHGSNVPDANQDETDNRDETIVPIDYDKSGMITDDWLFDNFITKVPKGANLWSLMDSCHSGTVLDLRHNFTSGCKLKPGKTLSEPYVPANWTSVFVYTTQRSKDVLGNIYMFSGAMDPQYATDAVVNGKAQGAFTACFLECLNNNLPNLKNIKLYSILKEVNVRLEMKKFMGQRSQLSLSRKENYASNLDL